MTYEEITLFLESLFISQGLESKLNLKQLMNYRLSIENCPLLEELLNYYLPYARKTQRLIWDAVWRYREDEAALLDVHDPALAGPRLLAKSWLSANYPLTYPSSKEKIKAVGELLNEIKDRIAQGLHDSSLELQYKQCKVEIDVQQRTAAALLPQDSRLQSALTQTLDDIRTDFITYLDELSSAMLSQTAGVNELLSLKLWIDSATENESEATDNSPLQKKSDRWALLIETIDESRTAYIAGGSFANKQRSCPIGVEERILDRVSLFIQALDASPEPTIAQKLIQQLIVPFVEHDFETKSFLPTQRLYQLYLQAASYDIVHVETYACVLNVSQDESVYQQSCQRFIDKELAAIDTKMRDYLEKTSVQLWQPLDISLRIEINKIKSQLRPYLNLTVTERTESVELCSEEEIKKSLRALFSYKINQIEQEADYLESLSEQDQQIFRPLFRMHSTLCYQIEKKQSAESTPPGAENSDAEIIANMAKNIGFGPEHVTLLLAIIGQSRSTPQTAGNRDRLGGMELLEKYALENKAIHGAQFWCEIEKQEWKDKTTQLYWDYIEENLRGVGRVPFLSLLPDNFDRKWLTDTIDNYFLQPRRQLPLSNALFARLYSQGDILLPIIDYQKHIFKLGLATGATALLQQLVEQGVLRHFSEQMLHTCLQIAVKYGHADLVDVLLNFSDRFWSRHDTDNQYAEMLITEAVSHGHASVVDLLIRKGIDFSFVDNDKKDLLICAAEMGHLCVIETLLRHNPAWNINYQDSYLRTALLYAIEQGHKQVVGYLLLKKAKVDCCDIYQQNAVLIAAERGQFEILQLLLHSHPKLNLNVKYSVGHTPLIIASIRGHLPIVELLLRKQVYRGCRDNLGRNALVAAAANRQSQVVELLLTEPYYIQHIDSKDHAGMTAMMHAVSAGSFEIAELLLEKGARCHHFSKNQESFIFFALGYEHSTRFLKNVFKSPSFDRRLINASSASRMTCLKKAIEFDDMEKIELLLEYGAVWRPANTNQQRQPAVAEYLTALRDAHFEALWGLAQVYSANSEVLALAVFEGNSAAVNLLLSIGTPLPQVIDGQENLLMYAAKHGDKNTLLCLLAHMADYLDYKNENGLTVLQIAEFYNHADLVTLINQFQHQQELEEPPSSVELLLLSERGQIGSRSRSRSCSF